MFNFTPQDLRRHATVHEQILWTQLRARQMLGLKFRRQHPMGPFIVDFVCLSKRLIIEMDGPVHESRILYDQKRDAWLRSKGFTVLRIKNDDLDRDRVAVLWKLRDDLMRRIGL